MSFSGLPFEMKVKIFKYMKIGSCYNASLVWEEMKEETLKLIRSRLELKDYSNIVFPRRDGKMVIETVDDLEMAGVLASLGEINSLGLECIIDGIDMSTAPINIVNSLLKVLKKVKLINITGFCASMLEDVKCEKLELNMVEASTPMNQDFNLNIRSLTLNEISGDVGGLLNLFGHLTSLEKLYLEYIDVSKVHLNIVNSLFKVVKKKLTLFNVTGFHASMLKNIKCEEFELQDCLIPPQDTQVLFNTQVCVNNVTLDEINGDVIGLLKNLTCNGLAILNVKLSEDELRSLVEMFQHRLKKLIIHESFDFSIDYSPLTEYDGLGCCKSIVLKNYNTSTPLDSWADSVDWSSSGFTALLIPVLAYRWPWMYYYSFYDAKN